MCACKRDQRRYAIRSTSNVSTINCYKHTYAHTSDQSTYLLAMYESNLYSNFALHWFIDGVVAVPVYSHFDRWIRFFGNTIMIYRLFVATFFSAWKTLNSTLCKRACSVCLCCERAKCVEKFFSHYLECRFFIRLFFVRFALRTLPMNLITLAKDQ